MDTPCCGVPLNTLGKGEVEPQTLFNRASSSCLLSSLARRSECSVWVCCNLTTSLCMRQGSLLVTSGVKDWLSGSITHPAHKIARTTTARLARLSNPCLPSTTSLFTFSPSRRVSRNHNPVPLAPSTLTCGRAADYRTLFRLPRLLVPVADDVVLVPFPATSSPEAEI